MLKHFPCKTSLDQNYRLTLVYCFELILKIQQNQRAPWISLNLFWTLTQLNLFWTLTQFKNPLSTVIESQNCQLTSFSVTFLIIFLFRVRKCVYLITNDKGTNVLCYNKLLLFDLSHFEIKKKKIPIWPSPDATFLLTVPSPDFKVANTLVPTDLLFYYLYFYFTFFSCM